MFHPRASPPAGRRLVEMDRWIQVISVLDLQTAIHAYLDAHNDNPKPFIWTATAESIITKVKRGRVALKNTSTNLETHH